MIPIENSVAGRVADIHHLMPASRLHIIGEFFLPVNHHLLAVKGARLDRYQDVCAAMSMPSASAAISFAQMA